MKILLVIDQFDDANNGTTISTQRFAQTLRDHGNEVRVVSTGVPGPEKYRVRELHLPPIAQRNRAQAGNVLCHSRQGGAARGLVLGRCGTFPDALLVVYRRRQTGGGNGRTAYRCLSRAAREHHLYLGTGAQRRNQRLAVPGCFTGSSTGILPTSTAPAALLPESWPAWAIPPSSM